MVTDSTAVTISVGTEGAGPYGEEGVVPLDGVVTPEGVVPLGPDGIGPDGVNGTLTGELLIWIMVTCDVTVTRISNKVTVVPIYRVHVDEIRLLTAVIC